jgi:uncharacterized protein
MLVQFRLNSVFKIAGTICLTVFITTASLYAEEQTGTKQKEIKKLLILTGAEQITSQVLNRMILSFKELNPEVPSKFWDEFAKQANAEQLTDSLVPIYNKYFTQKEIKQLIDFYQSPVGKKFVKVQPEIMKESMEAGQKWGQALGQRVQKKLKAEGYE